MVAGSSCTSRRRAEHQTGPVQGPAPGLVPGPAVRRRTRVLAPGPALGLAPGRRPSLQSAGRAAPTVRATAPVPGAGARRRSAVRLPSRPLPSGRAPTEQGLCIFLPLSFKQRSNASCLADCLFDFILAQALVAFIMISCMSPHLMPVEVATNFCLLRERGSGKHRNIQSCAQCGNHFLPVFFSFFHKFDLAINASMKGCNALRDKAQLHPF